MVETVKIHVNESVLFTSFDICVAFAMANKIKERKDGSRSLDNNTPLEGDCWFLEVLK